MTLYGYARVSVEAMRELLGDKLSVTITRPELREMAPRLQRGEGRRNHGFRLLAEGQE